jgi:hypothetical protein
MSGGAKRIRSTGWRKPVDMHSIGKDRRTMFRLILCAIAFGWAAAPASAQLRSRSYSLAAEPAVLQDVAPTHRDAVRQVILNPTMKTRATEEAFAAHTAVYAWMIDHPDRVSVAWQRLDVPCVEITSPDLRKFEWKDEQGSKLSWHPVAKLANGVVWYATGQVKPGLLMPMVPVKAVAVLKYPGTETPIAGVQFLKPEIEIWFQTDSKAAAAMLKMAGPAAPKIAEDAAGQLLYFFSGVAGYLHRNPNQVPALLAEKKPGDREPTRR